MKPSIKYGRYRMRIASCVLQVFGMSWLGRSEPVAIHGYTQPIPGLDRERAGAEATAPNICRRCEEGIDSEIEV